MNMNEKWLQRTAYLYGRSMEKIKHSHHDGEAFDGYVALSVTLWHTLKANGAVHDDGRLKLKFIPSMELGRDSVVKYRL